ncbi:MAG: cadherin-like beta sandwich domain-containing protein [Prosthecobacter sp.]
MVTGVRLKVTAAGPSQGDWLCIDELEIYGDAQVPNFVFGSLTAPQPTATTATLVTTLPNGYALPYGHVLRPVAGNQQPRIGGSGVTDLPGTLLGGIIESLASGLMPNTTYAVAAYATFPGGSGLTYTPTDTFRTKDNDANLSSITFNAGTLSPAFSPGATNYDLGLVPNATATLTFTPLSASTLASVTGPAGVIPRNQQGSQSLAVGVMQSFDLTVTAEDGTMKTYSFTAQRATAAQSDPALSSLTASSGALSPSFAGGTTSYSLPNVPNATSSITLTPTRLHSGTTIKVNNVAATSGSPFTVNLTPGDNTITVLSTAEDGVNSRSYTIAIHRYTTAEEDPALGNLVLSAGSLAFDPGTTSYTTQVTPSTTSITVTPTQGQPGQVLRVNGSIVASGAASASIPLSFSVNNTITVSSTSVSGAGRTYTLVVQRLPSTPALSGLGLSAGALSPAFASATTSYSTAVPNSPSSITLTPTAAAGLVIQVNGVVVNSGSSSAALPLNEGPDNTITILVTAEDGVTTRTYTLAVNRYTTTPSLTSLEWLTTSAGPVSPFLDDGTSNYTLRVANGVSAFTVTPRTRSFGAASVNGVNVPSGSSSASIPLSLGNTAITIDTTSQDGTATRSYTLTVTRYSNPRLVMEDNGTPMPEIRNRVIGLGGQFTEAQIPVGLEGIRSIAAGSHVSFAVKHDGSVVAWGNAASPQLTVPLHAQDVARVIPGVNHVAALHTSGQVSVWGTSNPALTPPQTLPRFSTVVTTSGHCWGLAHSGTVISWGVSADTFNTKGNWIGHLRSVGDTVIGLTGFSQFITHGPTDPLFSNSGNLKDVFADQFSSPNSPNRGDLGPTSGVEMFEIRSTGELRRLFWQYQDNAQQGVLLQISQGGTGAAVSGYALHSLALVTDGTVRTCGDNTWGQLNLPPGLSGVSHIAAGAAHSLFVVDGAPKVSLVNGDRTLTIRNTGTDPLTLGAFVLEGADASEFTVTTPGASTLAPGGSTSVTVSVPPGSQPRTAMLRVPNNDISTTGDFRIQLTSFDAEPPAITPPATVIAPAVNGSAVVNFAATVVDKIDPAPVVIYTPASGSTFPYGNTTVNITATDASGNQSQSTFIVRVTVPAPTLETTGGSFLTNNLAGTGATFAKDLTNVPPHAIAKIADGLYGNANSWLGGTLDSFIGVNLGSSPVSVNRIAFGRDNTGTNLDRWQGSYIIEYTTVPNPGLATPNTGWIPIADMDYPALAASNALPNPARRHVWSFPTVQATGIRLRMQVVPLGETIAIDELEVYDSSAVTPASRIHASLEGRFSNDNTASLIANIGSTRTVPVILRNLGISSVNLTSVSLLGGGSAAYSLSTSGMSTTLAAGASTTASLSFAPIALVAQSTTLRVISDDATTPQLDLVITGTGQDVVAPVITPPAAVTSMSAPLAGAIVNYPAATVVDDFDSAPVVTYSKASGSLFPIGNTTVTITATDADGNTSTSTFVVTVTAVSSITAGGALMPGNLAPGKPVWATSELGIAPHTVANINDGLYGNASSWIAGAPLATIGVNLGATPVNIGQLAFGRDNTGQFSDRWTGLYHLEVTTTPNPGATTPESAWTRLGTVDLTSGALPSPGRRRLLTFSPVPVTGVRLVMQSTTSQGICVDELELYDGTATPAPAGLVLSQKGSVIAASGTYDFGRTGTGLSSTRTFQITNTAATSTSLSVTHSGGNSADFTLNTTSLAANLAAGASTAFTITFTAGDGSRSTTLQINGSNFTLTATGGDVTPPTISHPDVVQIVTSVGPAVVIYAPATVTDNADPAPLVTYSPTSGSTFPFGRSLVTVTATDASGNISTATFAVTVRLPAPVLIDQGGPAYSGNLVTDKTIFAKDHIGIVPHSINGVKDGVYGDTGSWIAGSGDTFICVNFGTTPVSIGKIAFGRDNTGTATDRWSAIYTLQFTTSPNPNDGTLDSNWHDLGTLDYTTLPQTGLFSLPARRHVWQVHPVMATGLRLRIASGSGFSQLVGIDELEAYDTADQTAPRFNSLTDISVPIAIGATSTAVTYSVTTTDNTDPSPLITFSPPSGSSFTLGTTTVTITATDASGNSSTGSFKVIVAHAALMAQGASFGANNLASGKTAFAKDEIGSFPHAISKVNNGLYGNSNSWIAGSNDTFIGINLGSTPITLNQVAWGRDNTGANSDRVVAAYTLQYTNVPSPDATTPDSSWTSIETLDYSTIPYVGNFSQPARRHLWSFANISATGFRLKITSAAGPANQVCIDELELYGPATVLDLWRSTHFGSATALIGNLDDFDGDGIVNLLEFASGTLPTSARTGSLSYTGNVITPGQPVSDGTNAVFIRRKDRIAAGLVYTVEFSPDLTTWTPSSTTPTILADDGTHEVVSVSMPALQTRHFFRVKVNTVP